VPDEPIRVLVCDDQSVVRVGYATILSAQPDGVRPPAEAGGERGFKLISGMAARQADRMGETPRRQGRGRRLSGDLKRLRRGVAVHLIAGKV
jgi:hypothetical protein